MGLGLNGGGKLDFSPTLITKHSFSPEDNAEQTIKTIQSWNCEGNTVHSPRFSPNPSVPFPLLPHALLLYALSASFLSSLF